MKTSGFLSLVSIGFLFAAGVTARAAEWSTFTSADGDKQFAGRLVTVNPRANTVTVQMRENNRQVTFRLAQLSEEDQARVLREGLVLAAMSSLRASFRTHMQQTSKSKARNTTTTAYKGICEITITNNSTVTIENVEVDYIVVWRANSFDDRGEHQLVHGSHSIASCLPNISHRFETNPIPMKAVFKLGNSTTVAGGGCAGGGCGGGGGVIAERNQRSRDQLVGVLIQVKVNDEVVLTDTSNRFLTKYFDQFNKDGHDKEKDKY